MPEKVQMSSKPRTRVETTIDSPQLTPTAFTTIV